ncbi:MAG: hypothetical protein EXS08_04370 [Planctomycetes bacterium]|nr:hypothetical protein [Planctomycetota bacterium]
MHRNLLLSLGLVSTLVGSATSAQTKGALGRDNTDFARKLFERGYTDLAEGLCKTLTETGVTGNDQLEVQALGFELAVARIQRDPDLAGRVPALRKVIEDENAFIKANARTSTADVVRTNLPNVYLELAGTLTRLVELEKDAGKRAELIALGELVFRDGKAGLDERLKRFADAIQAGQATEYVVNQHRNTLFNLAKMEFQSAQLYPEGSSFRTTPLEAALKLFQDYGYDYSDKLDNYQGIIYQGLCHEGLGLPDDALTDYTDALALRELELYELDAKGQYQVGEEEANVISGATLQLVKLLTKQKRTREAIGAAEEFRRTIPGADSASAGLKVLEAKAEAEIAAGDIAGASATGQMLVDLDPDGVPGRMGRAILARLPVDDLAPDKILGIAETSSQRGEFNRALDLCRRARETAKGARDEQEIGAASFYLAGSIYKNLPGRLNEASLAFDLAAELYPNGSRAPDALNGAVNAYRELSRRDKSRFYSDRANSRMTALATKYSKHPAAANAGIFQGLQLEDLGDYAGAIQLYEKIPAGQPVYYEAAFRIASATYSLAQALKKDKPDEAAKLLALAEERFRAALTLFKRAQDETLDPAVLARINNWAFSARIGLATLLIDNNKAGELKPVLDEAEAKVGNDADKSAAVWGLRIQGLQAEGKLDEAVRLFESLLKGNPDAPGIARSAGVLARALDKAAQAEFDQDHASKKAEEQWRKAAFYYSLSVERALAGTAALQADDVSEIAQRLYVLGLFFNHVPDGQFTFVDWQGEVTDTDLWEKTARIYEKLEAQAPSKKISIAHARVLGILKRTGEAEDIYARLFDQVTLLDPKGNFDNTVVEAMPELLSAYLEWAVATNQVGLESNDDGRLDRAYSIYERIAKYSSEAMRLWWQAKYSQIKLLSDRGKYDDADLAVRNVKRGTGPKYDEGKFGFQEKLQALEAELSKKVKPGSKPKPAAPPPPQNPPK